MNNYQLIYPSVNLFLYDLREGLGQDAKETKRNRIKFWRKIDPELDKQIQELAEVNLQESADKLSLVDSPFQKKLKELEAKENPDIESGILWRKKFHEETAESHLDGYYYARQFEDTYCLLVNSSGSYSEGKSRQKNDNSQSLDVLAANKQIIVSHVNQHPNLSELEPDRQGTIGQSWFAWGQLAKETATPREMATECYRQLNPNSASKLNLKEMGKLAGATVFECGHLPVNWEKNWQDFSGDNFHLIVCLFPPSENPEEIENNRQKMVGVYLDFARLLWYRHKIVWAYWQSRRLKKELKKQSGEIKRLVDKVEDIGKKIESREVLRLKELQLTLTEVLPLLSGYAKSLNLLESQERAIAINQENYRRRLEKLERENNGELEILRRFSNIAEEKYRQQIESDCKSLSPELKVLENLISTMRGIIDLEQTRSDRDLNVTVGVLGTAVAASGIIATVAVGGESPPKSHLDWSLVKSPSFGLSILPVAIALIILLFRWRHRPYIN